MDFASLGILAAQLAVSAASIAASIFIPPPFGLIISAAIEGAMSLAIDAATGGLDFLGAVNSIGSAALSFVPFGNVASTAGKLLAKQAPKLANTINKVTMNIEKITKAINKRIESLAPDKLLERAASKLNNNLKTTKLQDEQLILKKQMELETYGEQKDTREKKINSITYNKDEKSWIKAAHFLETKFIDRNNIQGDLTIIYYQNNDSRLGNRVRQELNGNNNLVKVTIHNARYKNDYVSGICRAKSWGAYYMRTWMIGKPGRAEVGINTAIFFGDEWRVDKKLQNLVNQYKNIDDHLINFSTEVAEKFIGKTKIGTKLLSYRDVYTKTQSTMNQLKSGNASALKPWLKKLKKGK